VPEPRLTAWYGDHDYAYSGRKVSRAPWTKTLRALKARVEAQANGTFNSVFLIRYRDGTDSMGMHSDDERELGTNPLIASLSFGATRRFVLEPKRKSARAGQSRRRRAAAIETDDRMTFELGHGDLLVMSGSCQHHYRHGVPKQATIRAERLNLTFRHVH
jgi:alkylated DNA repair dioxygenase AlkB